MQERPQNAQTAAPSSPQVWNPPPLSTERHPERNALQSEALAGSGRDPSEALFREVSALAETLGYVGLTRTALSRAMAQGGSLLADYRA